MKHLIYGLLVVLLLLAACTPAQAPEEVVAALGENLNDADLEGAMALIAEDMVFDVAGEEMRGADNVRGMFAELISGNFRIQYEYQDIDGNTVTTKTSTWGEGIPQGAEPNVAAETYVIEDGRIARITWTPTEETLARLMAVSMVHELGALINSGDAAGAAALLADDVVFDAGGDLDDGKAAVQRMFEELIAGDFRIEQEVTGFDGRVVTSNTTTWGAGMPPEVEPLEAVETYLFEDGKIVRITWTPTEESAAKLAAAMAASTE